MNVRVSDLHVVPPSFIVQKKINHDCYEKLLYYRTKIKDEETTNSRIL